MKKPVLSVVYMKLKCWRLQTGLPDLKNQTIENLLMVDFLRILKKIMHFSRFFDFFLNSLVADAYMVKCTLLYLNIVGQTQ